MEVFKLVLFIGLLAVVYAANNEPLDLLAEESKTVEQHVRQKRSPLLLTKAALIGGGLLAKKALLVGGVAGLGAGILGSKLYNSRRYGGYGGGYDGGYGGYGGGYGGYGGYNGGYGGGYKGYTHGPVYINHPVYYTKPYGYYNSGYGSGNYNGWSNSGNTYKPDC